MASSLNNNEAMTKALNEIANENGNETNGNTGKWDSRQPVDYNLLTATGPEARALQEAGSLPPWAFEAAKYEWDDEYGEVGPEDPEFAAKIFSKEYVPTVGDHIEAITGINVTQEGPEKIQPVVQFDDAGLHPQVRDNIARMHYNFLLPVQAYCIPAVLLGHDVIAVAQTGSGKTGAYLMPMISKLMGKADKLAAPRVTYSRWTPADAKRAEPLIMVLCPTRELAQQVYREAVRVCYRSKLRPVCAYGGTPRRAQLADLQHGCDVLIGTVGRIRDFVTTEGRWLSLKRLKATIFDEADELLDEDWEHSLKDILIGGASKDDDDHQYMMFSATFPKRARELARQYLADDHIRIRVGRVGAASANIFQSVVFTNDHMKDQAVYDLLMSAPPCRTLIYVNTISKCEELDSFLYRKNLPVTSAHSKKNQREREMATREFAKGNCPILVATGIAARGMDYKNVMHVINYDLPSANHGGITEYVHRIGRTGRIGNIGQATSFYNERNSDIAEDLVKALLETKQIIPDFLEQYRPQDGELDFNDDTDDEAETGGADVGEGGWGGSSNAAGEPAWGDAGANGGEPAWAVENANEAPTNGTWGGAAWNNPANTGNTKW